MKIDKADEFLNKYGLGKDSVISIKAVNDFDVGEVDKEKRTIITTITTAGIDRSGDIVRPDGVSLKNYRKNPVVLWMHGSGGMFSSGTPELPIGKNLWIKPNNKGLVAKTQYANHELADKVFEFRQSGFPLAQSIGFMIQESISKNKDGKKNTKFNNQLKDLVDKEWLEDKNVDKVDRIITKWELLEYSDVIVPANPEALGRAVELEIIKSDFPDLYKESQDNEMLMYKTMFPDMEIKDIVVVEGKEEEVVEGKETKDNEKENITISIVSEKDISEDKALTHNSKTSDTEPVWGDLDKTKLPQKAFADEGEPDKKSTWKYPHHWVKNGGKLDDSGIFTTGDMFLHKGGLNAAWAAAQGARTGKPASASIIAHLSKHRKDLGLKDAEEIIEKEILASEIVSEAMLASMEACLAGMEIVQEEMKTLSYRLDAIENVELLEGESQKTEISDKDDTNKTAPLITERFLEENFDELLDKTGVLDTLSTLSESIEHLSFDIQALKEDKEKEDDIVTVVETEKDKDKMSFEQALEIMKAAKELAMVAIKPARDQGEKEGYKQGIEKAALELAKVRGKTVFE